MSEDMIRAGLGDLVDNIHKMGWTILPSEVLKKYRNFCDKCIRRLEAGCEYESCTCDCHNLDDKIGDM